MARPRKTHPAPHENFHPGVAGLPGYLIELIDPALSKTGQLYGIMRRAIANMHLVAGNTFNERLKCKQLRISRMSVRGRLLHLTSADLAPFSHLAVVVREQCALADSLQKRKPDDTTPTMKVHIDRVVTKIRCLIVKQRDYFAAGAGDVLDGHANGR